MQNARVQSRAPTASTTHQTLWLKCHRHNSAHVARAEHASTIPGIKVFFIAMADKVSFSSQAIRVCAQPCSLPRCSLAEDRDQADLPSATVHATSRLLLLLFDTEGLWSRWAKGSLLQSRGRVATGPARVVFHTTLFRARAAGSAAAAWRM